MSLSFTAKLFSNKCRKTLRRRHNCNGIHKLIIYVCRCTQRQFAATLSLNACQQTKRRIWLFCIKLSESGMVVFVISPEAKCHLNLQFLKRQSFFCLFDSMVTMMSISTLSATATAPPKSSLFAFVSFYSRVPFDVDIFQCGGRCSRLACIRCLVLRRKVTHR